jgi:hypothetical protein
MADGRLRFAALSEFRNMPTDEIVDLKDSSVDQNVNARRGDAFAEREKHKSGVVGDRFPSVLVYWPIAADRIMQYDFAVATNADLEGRVFSCLVEGLE